MKNEQLPAELFEILSMLYPALALALQDCELTLGEFAVLSHIKYRGRKRSDGQIIILRSEIGGVMDKLLTEGAVSNRINRLVNKKLIRKTSLTAEEKKEIYGVEGGPKGALLLLEEGSSRLDQFNGRINQLFQESTLNVPGPFLKASVAILKATSIRIKSLSRKGQNKQQIHKH